MCAWRKCEDSVGETVRLVDIAHARSGDKGDICNVGLIALDEQGYDMLRREVTAERVKAYMGGLVEGEVIRYELPNLLALNFVMRGALGGGGSRSVRIDSLGKTMAGALLRMEIEVD
jgi:hypothetical protein